MSEDLLGKDDGALIVVDIQADFCPGGRLEVPRGDEVIAPVNRLIARARHVILTQDWHPAGHSSFASTHPGRQPYESVQMAYGAQTLWPDHCVQGTPGAAFHRDLRADAAELVVRKGFRREIDSYSAFFENDRTTPTGLSGYLKERGLRRLAIAGLAFDFCVLWSAEDARRLGFDVVVARDACRALDVGGSAADAERRLGAAGARLRRSEELAP
jgi:nicotinamidase/pyrazinamidase